MINLGACDDLLRKYQEITPAHLTIKEITEEHRFGQGTHAALFWWVEGLN